MLHQGLDRHLVAHLQVQSQLPVLLSLGHAEHRTRRRSDHHRHPLTRLPPQAHRPLLTNVIMRRQGLMGQHVEGRQQERRGLTFGHQHFEESLQRIEQRLRLLIAVHHHQQLAARRLPKVHQVESLGR